MTEHAISSTSRLPLPQRPQRGPYPGGHVGYELDLLKAVESRVATTGGSTYEMVEALMTALDQATDGELDQRREFILRQLASEKCTGGWGYDDCLEADAMHLCSSCFVRRYLLTGNVTLRATEHLAAQCIAGAITAYQDTFKRNGRVDFSYWPARNEVEVHSHADEDGETEPHTIFQSEQVK